MSTENIKGSYHTTRALELLIASQKDGERSIGYGIPPDTELDIEHSAEYDTEHGIEHATGHDNSENDKSKARKNYFLLTFPVMVEGKAGGRSRFCTPFIFSLDDTLESMQERIKPVFGIGEWSKLKMVWAGSGFDFPSNREDMELDDFNTQAILRLLRQRGGVDKLVAEEGPLPENQG